MTLHRAMLLVALATSPLAFLSACTWLGVCSGVLRMFEDSVDIRNDSSSVVWITPLGRGGATTRLRVVPQHYAMTPTLPVTHDRRRRLAPGEHLTITYDSDKIEFLELVVEADGLRSPAIMYATGPYNHRRVGPIRDPARLPIAPPASVAAIDHGSNRPIWFVLFAFLVPTGFWLATRLMRPHARDRATGAA